MYPIKKFFSFFTLFLVLNCAFGAIKNPILDEKFGPDFCSDLTEFISDITFTIIYFDKIGNIPYIYKSLDANTIRENAASFSELFAKLNKNIVALTNGKVSLYEIQASTFDDNTKSRIANSLFDGTKSNESYGKSLKTIKSFTDKYKEAFTDISPEVITECMTMGQKEICWKS